MIVERDLCRSHDTPIKDATLFQRFLAIGRLSNKWSSSSSCSSQRGHERSSLDTPIPFLLSSALDNIHVLRAHQIKAWTLGGATSVYAESLRHLLLTDSFWANSTTLFTEYKPNGSLVHICSSSILQKMGTTPNRPLSFDRLLARRL